MEEFDLVVIGSGSGLNVASASASKGMNVAIIEEGPLGGTCLNRGCIPSKMIIHSADVAETIGTAHIFGIRPKGYSLDFSRIISRASRSVDTDSREIEAGIRETENMHLFKKRCRFVAEKTVSVGSKEIFGKKVLVAAGTRPAVPPIKNIENVNYVTSDEALRIKKQPRSMVIMGGGFIAAELAHFFGALGTKVTILQRSILLRKEDREISETFTRVFGKKYKILLGYGVDRVDQKGKRIIVTARKKNSKSTKRLEADEFLVATGRVPNTDTLDVEKGRIEVNSKGYIKVNEYLETSARNTWALGDIAGKYLLKHSANLEADYLIQNITYGKKKPVDYWPMPHAIFTTPQISSVGYTEEELKEKNIDYAVGKYPYSSTGMGLALGEKEGFVKILAEKKTHKILGCHIIGPEAASIIHEVIVAMRLGATIDDLVRTVHIHPTMPEVVQRAAKNISW